MRVLQGRCCPRCNQWDQFLFSCLSSPCALAYQLLVLTGFCAGETWCANLLTSILFHVPSFRNVCAGAVTHSCCGNCSVAGAVIVFNSYVTVQSPDHLLADWAVVGLASGNISTCHAKAVCHSRVWCHIITIITEPSASLGCHADQNPVQ